MKGSACLFRHVRDDSVLGGASSQVCVFWLQGLCTKEGGCSFAHAMPQGSLHRSPTPAAAPSPSVPRATPNAEVSMQEGDAPTYEAAGVDAAAADTAGSGSRPALGSPEWAADFRALVASPDAAQRKAELFALIAGAEALLPCALPTLPLCAPPAPCKHPENCGCAQCREAIAEAPALPTRSPQALADAWERCAALTEGSEQRWRAFMSASLRRLPLGLLQRNNGAAAGAGGGAV